MKSVTLAALITALPTLALAHHGQDVAHAQAHGIEFAMLGLVGAGGLAVFARARKR